MAKSYILTIDQGTTSTRVVVFDSEARAVVTAQREFTQHYPKPGWVEHDAEEIWSSVAALTRQAIEQSYISPTQLAAIAITNQRETTVVWDRRTGVPVHRAIVWQDRRTADFCAAHKAREPWIQERSGLVLDPYFSGTKIRWLLDNVAGAREQAAAGHLAFGTIDSFLIWRLTAGARHVTDVSNASRTLLLNLKTAAWDAELCEFLGVPGGGGFLPQVLPSSGEFGRTRGLDFLPDGIPITGVAGDQQASLFGQGCFNPGDAKCTYGTGAFMLVHTGFQAIPSRTRLLTTLAATTDARPQYALEGAVFIAGAAIQWLRDGLKMIQSAPQVNDLAVSADPASPLIFVPALVGLGSPHWVPEAQGSIFGITRATTTADLARATLDGIVLQVHDLIEAVTRDFPGGVRRMRVDGGAARSDLLLQLQADVLQIPIERVSQSESTALGAALLAGLSAGVWSGTHELAQIASVQRTFEAKMDPSARDQLLQRWRAAVRTVVAHYSGRSGPV
jgi:glycerol kinase